MLLQQMITQDLSHEPSSTTSPAEIHISLCYYPSAERFTVTILQAKNIKVLESQQHSQKILQILKHGRLLKPPISK